MALAMHGIFVKEQIIAKNSPYRLCVGGIKNARNHLWMAPLVSSVRQVVKSLSNRFNVLRQNNKKVI